MDEGTTTTRSDAPAPVAVYHRTVRASLTRIWENVLDWEHLPWLHRTSFLGVQLIEQGRDGWRARIQLPPAEEPREALIDVRLDRPNLRYWTRTLEGTGAGTEILTRLEPREKWKTQIIVEFHVPGVPAAMVSSVGAAYTRLYAHLWGEDEAMMIRRQALLDTAPPRAADVKPLRILLGPVAALRRRVPFLVEANGDTLRVVELNGEVVAHSTTCPHRGGPLHDVPLEDGCLTCPWHGYRYDVGSGKNLSGHACHLAAALRLRIDRETLQAYLEPPRTG